MRCLLLVALVLAAPLSQPPAAQAAGCSEWFVTGYVPESAYTASGQPALVGHDIAAAPTWIPFGTVIAVEGFRPKVVLDRGLLSGCWVDMLVADEATAYAITGTYPGRIVRWGWDG
jgi:3D (Asp-Asp-Asp) domain-containing protein